MKSESLRQVMGKIRTAAHHLGVFEQGFPRILKGTPALTRSHLVLLRDCLPSLKRLLRFAAETVPALVRVVGLADQGTTDLVRASDTLQEIRRSTEAAVSEIFSVIDRVDSLLGRAAEEDGGDGQTRQALSEARDELALIMNALQFQDITAQQIEATKSLLAQLQAGLAGLMGGHGKGVDLPNTIEVAEGTFDANASFDRDRADVDQDDIDRLISGNTTDEIQCQPNEGLEEEVAEADSSPQEPLDVPRSGAPSVDATDDGEAPASEDAGETVSQDDIDALVNG
jgi:hypothetical protein